MFRSRVGATKAKDKMNVVDSLLYISKNSRCILNLSKRDLIIYGHSAKVRNEIIRSLPKEKEKKKGNYTVKVAQHTATRLM